MELRALTAELRRLQQEANERDARMGKIRTARTPGGLKLVYPDLFPEAGSLISEPMVANMVDIAARDTAEVIAPLPAFNCASSVSVSDKARRFAEKRTKIAYGYVEQSRLQIQMFTAADQYVTYGFAVGQVRLDFDADMPVIEMLDPRGCYFTRDLFGRVQRLYRVMSLEYDDALAKFPVIKPMLDRSHVYGGGRVELVRWHDRASEGIFCTTGEGMVVTQVANPVGKCLAHVFARPGLTPDQIGQFDDVLAVQAAKARFALLTLEAASKSVQAPLALPMDVQEIAIGPDAVLKSSFPEKIRRVGLDVPQTAFIQQGQLDQELRQGARYPDVRTGNTDASIVTGRGVQALMTGFDTQIKTAQSVFAEGLELLVGWCFTADEKVWPEREREVRGNANGTPYAIKYKPARDIRGDHTVDVQYGLMAGLNPNQALVFGLQARGDKLISRDFLRRQLPFSLDASEEEQRVDIEELRESLKQAVAGYAQAIPLLAQQGTDVSDILTRMATIIADRQHGVAIEESIAKAFAPKEPEAPAESLEEQAMAGGAGGGGIPGMSPTGLMDGVAPGQAGMGAGGTPDVMTLLAGLGSGGANLDAGIRRRLPV